MKTILFILFTTFILNAQPYKMVEINYLAILEPFEKEKLEKLNNSLFFEINNYLLNNNYELKCSNNGFSFTKTNNSLNVNENQKMFYEIIDATYLIEDYFFDKQNDLLFTPFTNLNIIKNNDYNWILSEESKKIENYTCFKATCEIKYLTRHGNYNTRNITAWFTPEINFNFGPNGYMGLPGMILEIEFNKTKLVATKINFSKEEGVITFPKNKNITEEEFNKTALKTN